MNNEFSIIEDRLKKVSVQKLSDEEKQTLWVSVVRAHTACPVVSPYSWMLLVHRRVMVSVASVLILVLAGGSTVAIADTSKPGDALFVLDRATENVVLALSPESKKDTIRVSVANERIDELESIISDESSRRLARVSTTESFARVEQPQAKSAPEATRMMASEVTLQVTEDSATSTEDAAASLVQDVQIESSDNATGQINDTEKVRDRKQIEIEEALSLVQEISSELERKGNKDGHDSVRRAMKRLSGRLDELPHEDNDSFRESFEHRFFEDSDSDDDDDDDDDEYRGARESVPEELFPTDPTLDSSGTRGSVQGESIRIDDTSDDDDGDDEEDDSDEDDD